MLFVERRKAMIPQAFKERMKKMLGEEYEEFISAIENEDAVRGMRINTLKSDKEHFDKGFQLKYTPIPYANNCYILESDQSVGNLPEHHSGMIYMQDPGAMASLSAIDIPSGAKVADLCSAPGGKSGQAAAMIGEDGFLFANEYVPKRAKITVSNFERLGIRSAMVSSMDTARLKDMFFEYFDFVIADVPCSGEGMFRKSEESLTEWSEENVNNCAKRQIEILNNAAQILKPGGYIIYSTCTYSIEENEMTVDAFIKEHPQFKIAKVKDSLIKATRDGISFEGATAENLEFTRRFYPHVTRGEGQFVALLKKEGAESAKKQTILYNDSSKPLDKKDMAVINAFFEKAMQTIPKAIPRLVGENIVLISHGMPVPPNSIFSAGVLLGEIRKGIFTPSHQFFSAYGNDFKSKAELGENERACEAYLRGEELEAPIGSSDGWCAVTYNGAVIGGAKISGGRMKNHYPKGLRNK